MKLALEVHLDPSSPQERRADWRWLAPYIVSIAFVQHDHKYSNAIQKTKFVAHPHLVKTILGYLRDGLDEDWFKRDRLLKRGGQGR